MARSYLILLFSLFLYISSSFSAPTYPPVVLMHGIGGTYEDLVFMGKLIQQHAPGTYVKNIDLGGRDTSVWRGINDQIDRLCEELAKDETLQAAGAINLIGTSQGGIVARGFLERCNNPPVLNFVSWVSPQGGQFGVPGWFNDTIEEIIERVAECCVYDKFVQDNLSVAGYWRDPYQEVAFMNNSVYLPDVDNLRPHKNHLYKQRILNLKNFIMSYSLVDDILRPKQNGWFAHFARNTEESLVWLEDTDMYKNDWIGLRTLDETGRLHRFTTNCDHADYESQTCFVPTFMKNVMPFLQIPLADQL